MKETMKQHKQARGVKMVKPFSGALLLALALSVFGFVVFSPSAANAVANCSAPRILAGCVVSQNCTSQPVNWTAGAYSCNGTTTGTINHGAAGAVSDSNFPTTGDASFSCADGILTVSPGATCSSAADCNGGDVSWIAGSATCTGTVGTVVNNATSLVTDSTGPATGSATFKCINGCFKVEANTGATCTDVPPVISGGPGCGSCPFGETREDYFVECGFGWCYGDIHYCYHDANYEGKWWGSDWAQSLTYYGGAYGVTCENNHYECSADFVCYWMWWGPNTWEIRPKQ